MAMRELLQSSLKAAMKSSNDDHKRVLRLILAAAKLAEIEKGSVLDDVGYQSIIQKEVKIRREAIEGAERANRPDLIAINQQEISILEELLPKQLSDTDILTLAVAAANDLDAKTPADTGKVMKVLMAKVAGRASGDKVSQIVRQVLQNRS